jgi:methylated-DNA-[protein]-cysteine S-methyltransferase
MNLGITRMKTAIGPITLVAGPDGLCALDFDTSREEIQARLEKRNRSEVSFDRFFPLDRYVQALSSYFGGDLHAIDSLPVDIGGTDFQRRVWLRLRRIPAGRTLGYGQLADDLGVPGGARAVGLANGSNPVAIVVPCHRVVAANGGLGGYGGGLDRKKWLLSHEGARISALAVSGVLPL